MRNERLRASMAASRVDLQRLAEVVQVDPKTVQRWLAGRTPHPRHRWAIAAALDEDEHYLWPPEESDSPRRSRMSSWSRLTVRLRIDHFLEGHAQPIIA